MSTSMRNVLIAIVLAVGAATGVILYTTSIRNAAHKQVQTVEVLVATKDIEEGDAGDKSAASMTLKKIPVDLQVPGSIRDASGLSGLVATQKIRIGEQVVGQVFQKPIGQDAQVNLKPTERGVRMSLTMTSSEAGAVKPGDSVDLYATLKVKVKGVDDPIFITRRIIENVRILEIPVIAPAKNGDSATSADSEKVSSQGDAARADVMFATDQDDAPKVVWLAAATKDGYATTWMVVRPKDGAKQDETATIQDLNKMLVGNLTPAEFEKTFKVALAAVAGVAGADTTAGGTAASGDATTVPADTTTG